MKQYEIAKKTIHRGSVLVTAKTKSGYMRRSTTLREAEIANPG